MTAQHDIGRGPANTRAVDSSLQRILCLTDFGSCARAALDQALRLARAHGAAIDLLHVPNVPGDRLGALTGSTKTPLSGLAIEQGTQRLNALLEELPADDRALVTLQCRAGSRLATILQQAEARHADLIVMGAAGAARLSKYILGGTASKVLRHAACPVLCVPGNDARDFKQILVGTDFSECSWQALAVAATLARAAAARLVVAYASPSTWTLPENLNVQLMGESANLLQILESESRKRLAAFVARARLEGIAVDAEVLLLGSPAHSLLQHAEREGFDLVVLGTHGRSAPARLMLGSIAETVVHHAPVPVLTVRGGAAPSDSEETS